MRKMLTVCLGNYCRCSPKPSCAAESKAPWQSARSA
ncbi:protein-tyrosine-phosphatase [Streptomyces sp. CZ24]|nr:protein-tyrosine-phosphatase [Streptomyces sp. CZ24]